jgi:glycosyltransferase involved in cell wall biosynthesis
MVYRKKPLFSIITVVYNDVANIENTINSVLSQNFYDYEYIVVDGGSTDGTVNVIRNYSDKIDRFISGPDLNIYDAMNKGIAASSGKFLNFLNSGDEYSSLNLFEMINRCISKYDLDLVYGNSDICDRGGAYLKCLRSMPFNLFNLLFWGSRVVCHQSVFIRKSIAPNYNIKYSILSDYNWYIEILKNNLKLRYKRIDLSFVSYKLGGKSEKEVVKKVSEKMRIINKHFGFILIPPIACLTIAQYSYNKLKRP